MIIQAFIKTIDKVPGRTAMFILVMSLMLPQKSSGHERGYVRALAIADSVRAKKMNVLFIMADDLRPELGCYGVTQVKSPNLDRLAASGALFNSSYCQFPLCAPSRASLLSGTRPNSTKVYDLYTDFRVALPLVQTLPQLFKDHGYYTDRYGKIFHIDDTASWSKLYQPGKFGPSEPAKRSPYFSQAINEAGWKKFDAAKAAGVTGVALERSQRGPAFEIADTDDDSLPDGKTANQAIRALKELKKSNQPFFLAIGFQKPHLPFVAPRKYWDLYDRENIKVAMNVSAPHNTPFALGAAAEFYTYTDVPEQRPVPVSYARAATHGYYAAISYMDAQVGRVLDELENLGLADNTMVVFWGDHGFKLGEHGSWGKSSNFEVDARVPLIMRVPDYPTNMKINGMVEVVDIYPTLAAISGINIPSHVEGKSFAGLLKDARASGKDAVFTQCTRGDRMGYSMRTNRYRFTRWIKAGEKDALELYDHKSDPGENENIASRPGMQKLCADMTALMTARINTDFLAKPLVDEP